MRCLENIPYLLSTMYYFVYRFILYVVFQMIGAIVGAGILKVRKHIHV